MLARLLRQWLGHLGYPVSQSIVSERRSRQRNADGGLSYSARMWLMSVAVMLWSVIQF